MKRNLVGIDLLLLGLAIFVSSQLKNQWVHYQTEHNLSLLNPKVEEASSQKSASKSPEVPNYAAIVDNHLFSADRNNVVPVDPPAAPPKNLGPKPILMGTMGLGDDQIAFMISGDPKSSRSYKRMKVGEALNNYTLVKILDQKVVMSGDGKEVEVLLNEPAKLVARDYTQAGSSPNNLNNSERVTTINSASSSQGANPTNPNQSLPEGAIPPGAIVGGRKKVMVNTPFGPMETWEDVK